VGDDQQIVPIALLVSQKQVLRVQGIDPLPVAIALLGGRDRRVLVHLPLDSERS
jgi:hypothetical protein